MFRKDLRGVLKNVQDHKLELSFADKRTDKEDKRETYLNQ